jgi:hypothetical protein
MVYTPRVPSDHDFPPLIQTQRCIAVGAWRAALPHVPQGERQKARDSRGAVCRLQVRVIAIVTIVRRVAGMFFSLVLLMFDVVAVARRRRNVHTH